MIKNTSPLPHTGRTYTYLGAKVTIGWIYRWACADYYLVDLKYEGANEITYMVKWDSDLFVEV
jgi:hypothetical protein